MGKDCTFKDKLECSFFFSFFFFKEKVGKLDLSQVIGQFVGHLFTK